MGPFVLIMIAEVKFKICITLLFKSLIIIIIKINYDQKFRDFIAHTIVYSN